MKKGQEEAPIELLIGVTVLAFVLAIGLYTYQNLASQEYRQKLEASFSKFAGDLETIYRGGLHTSTTVDFDLSPPGGQDAGDIVSIRLLRGNCAFLFSTASFLSFTMSSRIVIWLFNL